MNARLRDLALDRERLRARAVLERLELRLAAIELRAANPLRAGFRASAGAASAPGPAVPHWLELGVVALSGHRRGQAIARWAARGFIAWRVARLLIRLAGSVRTGDGAAPASTPRDSTRQRRAH